LKSPERGGADVRERAFATSEPATAFQHEAFLYAGHEQFLAGTTAFIRGALAADEAVLVAVVEPRASLLREALEADAERVEFLDMATVGRNPARIIPAWQEWVERHAAGGRGFRGIGEPVWTGRSAREIVEYQRHEQLLNTAFDDGPGWWLLCPYDTAGLPGPVISRAHDTHPSLIADDARVGSASYPHPELSAEAMLSDPLEDPAGTVHEIVFDVDGLTELRKKVGAFAEAVLGYDGAEHVVLVVNELATNSIVYGGGAGTLRMWREDAAVVCETRDRGVITDPLVGRRRPCSAVRGKAGLWIANQLSDLLQIRSAPGTGTVVRAHLGGGGWT
jgi:anti-sigma regulatory factor (Ser/Thr protein kinase)